MVVLIRAEMRENSLYRNCSRGEPSMRLYIKNLGKQVVEQVCSLYLLLLFVCITQICTVLIAGSTVHLWKICKLGTRGGTG